ncbi:precorrin-2 C(20)-methyltransferase [Flavobacterium columnare]|uniref:precorrin-2 C(20)-methyltransferase n=1 Tax=Flavobacterium columnare TaxID=996 RepID=UPI001896A19C|nr:precorrin-2 C(20)-methyltransferase [Flavobacterium columnare]MBF6656462.1 precorrin-2 C(20)-methyltransferase [Flavobacterium columnare]MBF6659132.1 precorrin-2 C(20)-methyltransferase [Flavobacterium columnare]
MKKGKIYAVSLSPGDPELITLKGLKVLQHADKIYYPGSLLANGKKTSFSLPILKYHQLDENKLVGMFLQMSDDRTQAEITYATTFQSMLKDYNEGLTIVFVSEGDSLFYSTFAYLLEHIQKHQLDVEIIAGIPSFILGTAEYQTPLAILNEKIAIIPRIKNNNELEKILKDYETVVLIKIRSVLHNLISFLEKSHLTVLYGERLGTTQQYITSNINDIKNREIPYFSLLIIKKRK